MPSNSVGNDNRGIRKWMREMGMRPTVASVERMQREVRRTESQNEKVEKLHKEMARDKGIPSTVDHKGDVHARVRRIVQKDIERRRDQR